MWLQGDLIQQQLKPHSSHLGQFHHRDAIWFITSLVCVLTAFGVYIITISSDPHTQGHISATEQQLANLPSKQY